MKSTKLLAVAAVGLIALSGQAFASTVSNDQSKANTLVTAAVAPIASAQTASLIAGAIGNALGGSSVGGFRTAGISTREAGKSAGSVPNPLGLWVNGTYTKIDNGQAGGQFDGEVYSAVAGFDYKLTDRFLVGLGLGYEKVDISTQFNLGTFEGDGTSIAPYIGYTINKNWSVDGTLGYSWLSYDTTRNSNAARGSFDATRWFTAANLNGSYDAGSNVVLMPKVGVLYLEEEQDGYRESTGANVAGQTSKLGRTVFGGSVGYRVSPALMPYVKLMGEWDWEHPDSVTLANGAQSNSQDFGGVAGIGLNFNLSERLSGGVETSYNSLGRDDLDIWSVTAKLRFQF